MIKKTLSYVRIYYLESSLIGFTSLGLIWDAGGFTILFWGDWYEYDILFICIWLLFNNYLIRDSFIITKLGIKKT